MLTIPIRTNAVSIRNPEMTQFLTCSHAITSSVIISNKGIAFLSFLLNISLTIESKFHMPSGSLPRSGRSNEDHSAAAGGALVLR